MSKSGEWTIGAGRQIIEPAGDNRLGSRFVGVQEIHPRNPETGDEYDYRGLDVRACVHTVPITPQERLVFVQQSRPLACQPGALVVPRFLEFPGGFADCNPTDPEALKDAAWREASQEVGALSRGAMWQLLYPGRQDGGLTLYPQLFNEVDYQFIATDVILGDGPVTDEPTESDIKVVLLDPGRVRRIMNHEENLGVLIGAPTIATLGAAMLQKALPM